jgi:hypothetical protein
VPVSNLGFVIMFHSRRALSFHTSRSKLLILSILREEMRSNLCRRQGFY